MPKTIEDELSPSKVNDLLRVWAEQVTDDWIKDRPPSSPEHHKRKDFSREELVQLACIGRLADDVQHQELLKEKRWPAPNTWSPGPHMWILIQSLYKDFGFVIGFVQHVRDRMADDDGYYLSKATKVRERTLSRGGKIRVNGRMFRTLKRNPFVAAWFKELCQRENIKPSNPALSQALEKTGRYEVSATAPKESTRGNRHRADG
jgi:hypothetical protein